MLIRGGVLVVAVLATSACQLPGLDTGPTLQPVTHSLAGSPTAICLAALTEGNRGGSRVITTADLTVTPDKGDKQGWIAVDGVLTGTHAGMPMHERVHCTLAPRPEVEGGLLLTDWGMKENLLPG